MRSKLFSLLLAAIFAMPLSANAKTFKGDECTKDCSGHKAGYAWAQKKGITSPDQCGGKSNSFTEGCRSWATEHQAPSETHSDDKKVSMPLPGK
ncbi:MAG: hypothetical protein EBV03_09305 [Proteobacteria bacterium]|nr:hypothetical protein [Pseudomonadota bacterium]